MDVVDDDALSLEFPGERLFEGAGSLPDADLISAEDENGIDRSLRIFSAVSKSTPRCWLCLLGHAGMGVSQWCFIVQFRRAFSIQFDHARSSPEKSVAGVLSPTRIHDKRLPGSELRVTRPQGRRQPLMSAPAILRTTMIRQNSAASQRRPQMPGSLKASMARPYVWATSTECPRRSCAESREGQIRPQHPHPENPR